MTVLEQFFIGRGCCHSSLAGEGVWPGPEANAPDPPPAPASRGEQESRWVPRRGTEATALLLWGGRPSPPVAQKPLPSGWCLRGEVPAPSLRRFHGGWLFGAGQEAGEKRGFVPSPQSLHREVSRGRRAHRASSRAAGAAPPVPSAQPHWPRPGVGARPGSAGARHGPGPLCGLRWRPGGAGGQLTPRLSDASGGAVCT